MKNIAIYWGYLSGEEHLTEEQFADIDFGNPAFDTEFIIFDPLSSSYFQGRYFKMYEKKFFFPHRTLPSMRTDTLITYEDTTVKIFDPPSDLEAPVGIFLCLFTGKINHIEDAIKYISNRINLKFSPCEIDLEKFFTKLVKTRLQVTPVSLTISNLRIDEQLIGDLNVKVADQNLFLKNLRTYKPKNTKITLILKEVNFQLKIKVFLNGKIKLEHDIKNLNMLETLYDVLSRSVYTGILEKEKR